MPTSTVKEPEQLSLFVTEETEPACSEPATERTVPNLAPVNVPDTTIPATKKKQTDTKHKIAFIMAEEGFKTFYGKITDALKRNNFRELLKTINIDGFNLTRPVSIYTGGRTISTYYRCVGDKECLQTPLYETGGNYNGWQNNYPVFSETISREGRDYIHKFILNVAYTSTESAETLIVPIDITLVETNDQPHGGYKLIKMDTMEALKPAFPSKIVENVFFRQSEGELSQLVQKHKPWIVQWLLDNPCFKLEKYLAAPWLETLCKAGYTALAKRFLYQESYHTSNKEIEQFNRLCGAGTKPKDIFKCTKAVYSVLKDEVNLDIWDTLRRLEKKETITGDAILIVYQMGLRPKELELVNSILGQQYNNRPIFSLTSLVNYINRLDMYEAIPSNDAFLLLNDYLHMCRQLGMPPRIDGDSLKREHDIAARLCRERRNEIMEKKMKERAEQEKKEIEEGNKKLAKATYYENVFFVRPITEYNDLLDEAIQQDNCVASYADRIATGKSRIFTMRETAHPEKSMVTIELSPDCKTIRQKFLAHNQVIRNKAINDFIERWHKQLNAA